MMRKKTKTTLLVLCTSLCITGAAEAQSVFGLNFVGEHRLRGNARVHSLGFSALAVHDSTSAITQNTAALGDLTKVTFSIYEVLGLSRIKHEDEVVGQNRFQLPTVMLAIPFGGRFVGGIGYRTRFEGKSDFAFDRDFDEAIRSYEIYKHRSSLFTAPVVLAWKMRPWVQVAAELQIERGSVRDDVIVDFEPIEYASIVSKRNRSYSSTSWGVSMLLRPHSRLSLGLQLDGAVEYDVDDARYYSYEELDSHIDGNFTLPAAYGVGMSARITDRLWLTSTYWRREAPEPEGFEQLEGSLVDEWLLGFGFERRAAEEGGFFSRIPLRLGYYENVWHLEFPQGSPVKSRFVTFGTGFPLPGGPGTIDVSCEVGQIGSVDDNGIEEQVLRIGFGLNVSEAWSRRKKGRR